MNRPTKADMTRAARDYAPQSDFDRDSKHVDLSGPNTAISIRLPERMLVVLKGFAERQGVGYQRLIKTWLDERIRSEAVALRGARSAVPLAGTAEKRVTGKTGARLHELVVAVEAHDELWRELVEKLSANMERLTERVDSVEGKEELILRRLSGV